MLLYIWKTQLYTMATYSVSTFLSTPAPGDVRLKIYDKNTKLRHTIDPNIAYFFKKSHMVVIKISDRNDIYLDFASSTESGQALAKLNDAKKSLTNPGGCPVPPSGGGENVYSKANLNMVGLVTVNDGDLACSSAILDKPISASFVKVMVNGVEVNVGGNIYPYDCYFSHDGGTTVKLLGDEKQGDYLYWNGSIAGYQLDVVDLIDFNYLISNIT